MNETFFTIVSVISAIFDLAVVIIGIVKFFQTIKESSRTRIIGDIKAFLTTLVILFIALSAIAVFSFYQTPLSRTKNKNTAIINSTTPTATAYPLTISVGPGGQTPTPIHIPTPTPLRQSNVAPTPTQTLSPTLTPVPQANSFFVDDSAIGSGLNQFTYSGIGWNHCASSCANMQGSYDTTQSFTGPYWGASAGDYAQITFSGTQIMYYSVKDNHHGIAGLYLDSNFQANVDLYQTSRQPDALVWTSPLLPEGTHTFQIVFTNTRDSSSDNSVIVVDAVEIRS